VEVLSLKQISVEIRGFLSFLQGINGKLGKVQTRKSDFYIK